MRRRIIAIDVDLTVVDTLAPWLYWFKTKTGREVKNEDSSYDLVPEMTRLIEESGVEPFNPMEYWKRHNLYDYLMPLTGCVEVIQELKKEFDVIFVSSCITEHTDSKIRFLKKHFGDDTKFVSTFHKEFIDYDYLIDDRLHHMVVGNLMRPEATHILYTGIRTDGYAHERRQVNCLEIANWNRILNFFFPTY